MLDMFTPSANPAASASGSAAEMAAARWYAADEPSHIHIPRPGRVMRPGAVPNGCRPMSDRGAISIPSAFHGARAG